MPDLLDFEPIRVETVDTIRARMTADVNAGVDPESANYVDTTPNGWWWDHTPALELERLWDVVTTDLVAAAFPSTSWGIYLDRHGETLQIPRKDETVAQGEVTFSGTDGTLIAAGVEVSTAQTSPDEEPVAFRTTDSGTIAGGEVVLAVEAVEAGSLGNVAAGAIELLLSAVDGVTAVTNDAATMGGTDVEGDEDYAVRLQLEYAAAQGAGSIADYERWALAYPGIGNVRVAPLWNGAGTVRVVVLDYDNNPVPDSVRDGFQQQLDPFTVETALDGDHTFPDTTVDLVSTAGLSEAGRVYVGTRLINYTGISGNQLTGVTGGGTGLETDGTIVVQHGEGKGLAPVGAMATVATPTILTVAVEATVEHLDGYSLDGDGGTIATRAEIEAALRNYIDALPPGGENPPGAETPAGSGVVLLNKVEAQFFRVPGVYDVSGLTLNAAATNLAVAATQVPAMSVPTLSE